MATQAGKSGFDQAQADAFADEMVATLNHGALCLMLSLGHRVGLFDRMATMAPASSGDIAAQAGLDERYVREWLGAMVTAKVVDAKAVETNPATMQFSLPAAHAAYLTRAAAADNLAVFAQYIAVLGDVEDDIAACFRNGGGVPYARFTRFHEVMAEDSGQSVLSSLQSHIIPLLPGLHQRLSGGLRMLDLGCGRGRILNALAALYPASRFVGMDLSAEAIDYARREAADAGHDNVEFHVVDLSDFDRRAEPASFDFISTFDAIHDQARPLQVLQGIHRALKPDGVYLMQDIRGSGNVCDDIEHPIGTLLYTISCMHCMSVSLAQGGAGLGAMWGEPMAREYLRQAGFGAVATHRFAHDIQNNWYVATK